MTDKLRVAAQAVVDITDQEGYCGPETIGYAIEALRAVLAEPQQCEYRRRAGVVWDTSCGINSVLPMDAGKRIFCFHCGKPIKFVRGDDE